MSNSIYQLVLENKKNHSKYIIDQFLEETILSQEVIIDIVSDYREKLSGLKGDDFTIIYRLVIFDSVDGKMEEVVYIDNIPLFIDLFQKNNLKEIDVEIKSKKIKILDKYEFKI